MKNRFRILKVLIVVFLLAIVNMAVFFHVSGDNGTETRTTRAIEDDDEFLDFSWVNWNGLPGAGYPGDRIEFSFALNEIFNDEGWLDENDTGYPGGMAGWIFDAKVQITTNVPIDGSDLTPDYSSHNLEDTPQKYGQNFSVNSGGYVANEDGDDFYFDITKDDILVGDYTVTIIVTYAWILDYDWAEHFPDILGLYNWSNDEGRTETRSEVLTLDFEVLSCIGLEESEPIRVMRFTSTSTMPLYAGCNYQKVGVTCEADNPEWHLKNVTLLLTIPNSGETQGITLTAGVPHAGQAFIMDLYSGEDYFYFYIDVVLHMPAGEKTGAYLTMTYEREFDTNDDGQRDTWEVITETFQYDVSFMVAFTPFLDVPEHDYGQTPLFTKDHADLTSMETQISVDFVNNGNVDLFDVTVTLYLEDSYYFDEENWYQMETSGYMQSNLDPEVYLGDITIGMNATAVFDLSIFLHLPPASYALRIYYEATYYDDGATGNPTQMIQITQSLYDDIKDAQGFETYPFYDYPLVIVEITDDNGLDMYGWTGTYNPGTKGTTVSVYVMNEELYGITDIEVTLDGNGLLTDPIWGIDDAIPLYYTTSYNNDESWIPGDYPNWRQDYGGTYWYDQQRTFQFFVDVADDAADDTPYKWVYLDITGYDKHHTLHTVRVDILIQFANSNPSLIVTEAYSPDGLNPGDEFVYTVTFTNVGDSVAENVTVLLRDNQDIVHFQTDDTSVQDLGDLAPGDSATITYNLKLTDKALNTENYGDRYSMTLSWGFTTEKGYTYTLGSYSSTVYLRTSPIEQVDPVQEVAPTFSSDQSQVLSYVIFAIAIIIGALVVMFGLARLASNINKWRYEDYERKMGKPEKPKEEKPAMDEPEAGGPAEEEAPPEKLEDDEPEELESDEPEALPEPPEDEIGGEEDEPKKKKD
jgi:hypothetical protein